LRDAIPFLKASRPNDNFAEIEESIHTDYIDDELSDAEMSSETEAQCDVLRLAAGVGKNAWLKRRSACLSKQVSGKAVAEHFSHLQSYPGTAGVRPSAKAFSLETASRA
jgi:hypothetical protein